MWVRGVRRRWHEGWHVAGADRFSNRPAHLTALALRLAVGSFRREVAPPGILGTSSDLPEQAASHQSGKPRASGARSQPNHGSNLVGEPSR